MASVYRPSGRKVYRIEFKDQNGIVRTVSSGVTDQQVARSLGSKLQEDVDRHRVGLPPKHPEQTDVYLGLFQDRAEAVSLWDDAVSKYLAEIARRTDAGDAETQHLRVNRSLLSVIKKECHCKQLGDLRRDAFTQFLCRLAKKGRSPRTQNMYLQIAQCFLDWSVDQGWLNASPLKDMEKLKIGQAGRRIVRRAFTQEELQKLYTAVSPYRAMVYRVAAYSGFRRQELLRLRKEDCTPTGELPRWTVDARRTKNGQAVSLPMAPECARALRDHWLSLPEGSPLFPPGSDVTMRHNGSLKISKGNAAGVPTQWTSIKDFSIAGISRLDARGRKADFHSFRYTFCSLMARLFPIEVVSKLMRHSSIYLTIAIYLDLGLDRIGEGQWTIPHSGIENVPTAGPTAAGETLKFPGKIA